MSLLRFLPWVLGVMRMGEEQRGCKKQDHEEDMNVTGLICILLCFCSSLLRQAGGDAYLPEAEKACLYAYLFCMFLSIISPPHHISVIALCPPSTTIINAHSSLSILSISHHSPPPGLNLIALLSAVNNHYVSYRILIRRDIS